MVLLPGAPARPPTVLARRAPLSDTVSPVRKLLASALSIIGLVSVLSAAPALVPEQVAEQITPAAQAYHYQDINVPSTSDARGLVRHEVGWDWKVIPPGGQWYASPCGGNTQKMNKFYVNPGYKVVLTGNFIFGDGDIEKYTYDPGERTFPLVVRTCELHSHKMEYFRVQTY